VRSPVTFSPVCFSIIDTVGPPTSCPVHIPLTLAAGGTAALGPGAALDVLRLFEPAHPVPVMIRIPSTNMAALFAISISS
jgi:hypothetical protein